MLHNVITDLRDALRSLKRSPGFAAAAIATIALGIGVNTGIFSVINGVLFRDLPAPDAHELVSIYQTIDGVPNRLGGLGAFSTAEYRTYRDRSSTLAGVLGHSQPSSATLGGAINRQTGGLLVTCNYFDVLETPPAIGRALSDDDCSTGAAPVVVLGYELWTTVFAADPAILGRNVELNRRLFTVVGVAREGTYGGRFRAEFFAPVSAEPLLYGEGRYANDETGWLFLIGRRGAGVGTGEVRAELAVIAGQIDLETPGRSTTLLLDRARPQMLPPFVPALGAAAVLMAAFGLILLIACANVANLMLARGTARTRELAVRLSLGATRARLIRQVLTESVLLAIAGGVLGSLLALWSFEALLALAMPALLPVGLPPLALDTSPDVRVLTLAFVLIIGTGVVFGLAPALHASRTDLHSVMKQDSAGSGESRSKGRLRGTLVSAQVALSMLLIIGAGLLIRGLQSAQTIDPGFDSASVTVLSYDYVSDTGHDDDPAFWRRLRDDVAALPGVEGASYASREPLGDDFGLTAIRLPGQGESELKLATINFVDADYFSVVGLAVASGRTFVDADYESEERVAIVSASTARNLWGSADALNRTVLRRVRDQEVAYRIAGVVADAQVSSLGRIDAFYMYLPTRTAEKLLVRSRLDHASTATAIRGVVRALDPGLPTPVYSLEANLDRWRGISGLVTTLGSALGALGLILAAVGIYGVVSYYVGRRLREIGIRLALGARTAAVYRLVLTRTMRPVVVGAVLGLAGAVAMSGILSSVLFGVSPLDPLGIGGAALFVLGTALAAGGSAARRAVRVDPIVTLRYE